jgi:hypothetical protein
VFRAHEHPPDRLGGLRRPLFEPHGGVPVLLLTRAASLSAIGALSFRVFIAEYSAFSSASDLSSSKLSAV